MVWFDDRASLHVNFERSLAVGAIAMAVSFVLALASYYQGDKFVLVTSGAKPIEHKDDPQLYNVVEEMALAAGVPVPHVYLIDARPPTPSPPVAIRNTPPWRSPPACVNSSAARNCKG